MLVCLSSNPELSPHRLQRGEDFESASIDEDNPQLATATFLNTTQNFKPLILQNNAQVKVSNLQNRPLRGSVLFLL